MNSKKPSKKYLYFFPFQVIFGWEVSMADYWSWTLPPVRLHEKTNSIKLECIHYTLIRSIFTDLYFSPIFELLNRFSSWTNCARQHILIICPSQFISYWTKVPKSDDKQISVKIDLICVLWIQSKVTSLDKSIHLSLFPCKSNPMLTFF